MSDGDPRTTALAGAFGDAFIRRGGKIPAIAQIEKGQSDMTKTVAEFANAGVDGISFPVFPREATRFVRQARENDGLAGVTPLTGDGAIDPDFLRCPNRREFTSRGRNCMSDRTSTRRPA